MLIADYWWVRRNNLKLADLYRTDGVYRYAKGWNWIAVVSLLIGIVIAIGGAYSADATATPFPVGRASSRSSSRSTTTAGSSASSSPSSSTAS